MRGPNAHWVVSMNINQSMRGASINDGWWQVSIKSELGVSISDSHVCFQLTQTTLSGWFLDGSKIPS